MGFQKDFIWGAATAAYQIEGARWEDGKMDSVWDEFCSVPGATYEGQNGDIACDHYHHYKEDIALMKELGIHSYRFSISWTRIIPMGTGEVNEAGIRFYEDLINELLKNQITPFATLFHWDLPAALQRRGGWLNPQSPVWFEQYAEVIAKRFAGKVKYYFTINEPQCFIGLGYGQGVNAPGLKLSEKDCLLTVHNVLLAHGRAVKALRKYGGNDLKIGLAQSGRIYTPKTDSREDIEAARSATFSIPSDYIDALFSVSLWSEPILKGHYPQEYLEKYADLLPRITSDDMEIISQPIDFFAQNLYHATLVEASGTGWKNVNFPVGQTKTAMGWPVTPDSMYWTSKFLYYNYKLPVLISENGMSAHDTISLDGKVHDPNRIDYLHRYLISLKKAYDEGVNIMGYFAWSLLDNFEWAYAYHERFGIVYVDFQTQKRIPKDSAYWYGNTIEQNGNNL